MGVILPKGAWIPRGEITFAPSKIPKEVSISSGSHNAIAGGGGGRGGSGA